MTPSHRRSDPDASGGSAASGPEGLAHLVGEAGARRGFRKLAGVARRAAGLEAELRGLIERLGGVSPSLPQAAGSDAEALRSVLEVLEHAADAAETTASATEATLREMRLPWGAGEDEPASLTAPKGTRGPAAGSTGSPLLRLLAVARRAVRLEADLADVLWRLRLLVFLPDAEMSEAAGWALERLEPAGEAARTAAMQIEQIAEGAEDDPRAPSIQ